MKKLLIILLSVYVTHAQASNLVYLSLETGNTLTLTGVGGTTQNPVLLFDLNASYGQNSGIYNNLRAIDGGKLELETTVADQACKMTADMSDDRLGKGEIVKLTQEGSCGMGLNVNGSGTYIKVRK